MFESVCGLHASLTLPATRRCRDCVSVCGVRWRTTCFVISKSDVRFLNRCDMQCGRHRRCVTQNRGDVGPIKKTRGIEARGHTGLPNLFRRAKQKNDAKTFRLHKNRDTLDLKKCAPTLRASA